MGDSHLGRMTHLVSSRVKLLRRALLEALKGLVPQRSAESMLRQVDGAVDSLRAELGKAVAAGHLARKELLEQQAQHEELTLEVERAMDQAREDLARAAIARQLALEARLSFLEQQHKSSQIVTREIERSLDALLEAQKVLRLEMRQVEARRQDKEARELNREGAPPERAQNLQSANSLRVQARLRQLQGARAFKQEG